MTFPETVVLDTNCVIYRIDAPDSRRGAWLDAHVFRPAVAGQVTMVISVVTLAELLVRPYAEGLPERAVPLQRALETLPGLSITAVSAQIAAVAARLRGTLRLPMPDALIVATAAERQAPLLTNDRQLLRYQSSVPVLILDEEIDKAP